MDAQQATQKKNAHQAAEKRIALDVLRKKYPEFSIEHKSFDSMSVSASGNIDTDCKEDNVFSPKVDNSFTGEINIIATEASNLDLLPTEKGIFGSVVDYEEVPEFQCSKEEVFFPKVDVAVTTEASQAEETNQTVMFGHHPATYDVIQFMNELTSDERFFVIMSICDEEDEILERLSEYVYTGGAPYIGDVVKKDDVKTGAKTKIFGTSIETAIYLASSVNSPQPKQVKVTSKSMTKDVIDILAR